MKVTFEEVTLSDINSIITKAWALYQNPKMRFYPVIDNREEMERIYKEAFMYNHLWVLDYQGSQAYFPFILDRESQYIQANGGLACDANYDVFMDAILKRMHTLYPGYDFLLGYPSSNLNAMNYHQSNTIDDLCEVSIRTEIILTDKTFWPKVDHYGSLQNHQYEAFKTLHTQMNPEVYWDAQSILEHDDRWVVVTNTSDSLHSIAGAITFDKQQVSFAEVFFINSINGDQESLIKAMLNQLQTQGIENILCLVDRHDVNLQENLVNLGFQEVDDYYCFTRIL